METGSNDGEVYTNDTKPDALGLGAVCTPMIARNGRSSKQKKGEERRRKEKKTVRISGKAEEEYVA